MIIQSTSKICWYKAIASFAYKMPKIKSSLSSHTHGCVVDFKWSQPSSSKRIPIRKTALQRKRMAEKQKEDELAASQLRHELSYENDAHVFMDGGDGNEYIAGDYSADDEEGDDDGDWEEIVRVYVHGYVLAIKPSFD